MRRTSSSVVLLGLTACAFGFTGGGLPPGIHTVAIDNFENVTAEPTLTQAVSQAVKQAIESRLGLRTATLTQADAVVTGKIVRYDPDLPVAYNGTQTASGIPSQVNVTQRQVELTVDVTVVEQKTKHVLWEGKSTIVRGNYNPGQERDGLRLALNALVTKIVDGVHQNW